jgi:uncharacterized protein (DUF362 family)
MAEEFSRRSLLQVAGAAPLAAQQFPADPVLPPVTPRAGRSTVALLRGEVRRKLVHDALTAIDDQIRPMLRQKRYVVIKPNNVSPRNQLASTHADALRGILDYLVPRFKGPVVIGESSAGNTLEAFENFRYGQVAAEYGSGRVRLIDFNREGKYVVHPLIDANVRPVPVRFAARLLDPEAFVISSAMPKTHNFVVATLSVKNMVLGAPLHSLPGEKQWSDKGRFHVGVRNAHYNMMLGAQKLSTNWGVALIDGFEGMEGQGPGSGTPVASRIAIASTDFIAADRVGLECMGIDPSLIGYLRYCDQVGIGNYSLNQIDIRGERIAAVMRRYELPSGIESQLQWRAPLREAPPG